ncbi:hypothetical protein HMN09_01157000 [Mycena chlorophos]|uniref:Uncharacterized protein n=1 Tax=Mycena chlorophos TaxID=658473 RepID=A0A8H6S7J0_MYCCL|nr:hypothetical protein HMN09_01157000 [Mycena chlorophos]
MFLPPPLQCNPSMDLDPAAPPEEDLQIINVYAFGWDRNIHRVELVKIDVERRGIVRPDDVRNWGIFYDPVLQRADFYPQPESAVTRGRTSLQEQLKSRRNHRHFGPALLMDNIHPSIHPSPRDSAALGLIDAAAVDVPRPLANIRSRYLSTIPTIRSPLKITAMRRTTIQDDLASLTRRKDDSYGLHYALMCELEPATGLNEQFCLRMLLDSACPVDVRFKLNRGWLLKRP